MSTTYILHGESLDSSPQSRVPVITAMAQHSTRDLAKAIKIRKINKSYRKERERTLTDHTDNST